MQVPAIHATDGEHKLRSAPHNTFPLVAARTPARDHRGWAIGLVAVIGAMTALGACGGGTSSTTNTTTAPPSPGGRRRGAVLVRRCLGVMTVVLIVMLGFPSVAPASSATLTWTGQAPDNLGLWSNPVNWSPAQVPVSGDNLVFPLDPQHTLPSGSIVPAHDDISGLSLASVSYVNMGNGCQGPTPVTGNSFSLTGDITAPKWCYNSPPVPISNDIALAAGTHRTYGVDFGGALTGPGSLAITNDTISGQNATFFSNSVANTYTGGTLLNSGAFFRLQSAGVVALPAQSASVDVPSGANLEVDSDGAIAASDTVQVEGSFDTRVALATQPFAALINAGNLYLRGEISVRQLTLDPTGTLHDCPGSYRGVGPSAGGGKIVVHGTVTIGGNLALDEPATLCSLPANSIVIQHIPTDLRGAPPTTGTFVGLPEGASVPTGQQQPPSYTITYLADNAPDVGLDSSPSQPPAYLADTPTASAIVGAPYTYTFAASGAPSPTFALSAGALPVGLGLDGNTGVLSGTPTTSGIFTFTVQATNGVSPGAVTPSIIITVNAPFTWVAPTPLDGSDLLAAGDGTVAFQVVGQFEPGVTGSIVTPTSVPGLSCTPIGNIRSPRLAEADCVYRPGGRQPIAAAGFSAVRSDGTVAGTLTYSFASEKYVALGDSYSAGEGVYTKDQSALQRLNFAHALHPSGSGPSVSGSSGSGSSDYLPGTDTNHPGNGDQCHRSVSSGYPRLFAALVGLAFDNRDFWACSGALVSDITNPKGNHQWGQYPDDSAQVSHLGFDTTLVTMTVGGNDSGFAGVLKDCLTFHIDHVFGDCFDNGVDQRVSNDIAGLRTSLRDKLYAISWEAPNARILIGGYPHLYNLDGSGGASSGCGVSDRIEKRWLNAKAAELDGVIAEVAKNSGVAEYVEAYDLLGTQNGQHQVCGSNDPWINGIVVDPNRGLIDGAYAASFHPNDGGYHEYARRFAAVYQTPPNNGTPYTINQYQTVSVPINVSPQTPVMRFATRWPGSDVTMSLTSPSGRTISRSTVASDVTHVAGPTFEVYTVTNPEAGTWTVSLYGNNVSLSGETVRLDAAPAVRAPSPPTPVVAESTSAGTSPLTVTFDASASSAPAGSISGYEWDFGDGSTGTGAVVSHTYAHPGSYLPGVLVTDSAGEGAATVAPAVTVTRSGQPPGSGNRVGGNDGSVHPAGVTATTPGTANGGPVTSLPGRPSGPTSPASNGPLAFTGLSVRPLILAATAIVLLGIDMVLLAGYRRLGRRTG